MNLIIVESPTKARTLSRFLGKDYKVEATMGHIRDLPEKRLGVKIEKDFEPQYVISPNKKEVVEKLKKAVSSAKKVYLATDPDREGEAIAYHVAYLIGDEGTDKKQISRITFHEITEKAINEALAQPGEIKMNLVEAQVCRRVLDRLVGYKLSPLLWYKVRKGLSAGRVQSVAVRLIVEREREIEKFVPKEYWEIEACLQRLLGSELPEAKEFWAKLVKKNGEKIEIQNEFQAKEIVAELEKAGWEVYAIEKKETRRNPYPPFTTSTLQQAAVNQFGWSSKRTMKVAQDLYERGLITYHRTDSTNLAAEAVFACRALIEEKFGKDFLPEKPVFYKTRSKVAQEAHEAIRPTEVKLEEAKLNEDLKVDEKRLYGLIWKRFVACQMTPAIVEVTTLTTQATGEKNVYLLETKGEVEKFAGWRKVYDKVEEALEEGKLEKLPELKEGEELKLKELKPEQKFTQPPPRYTEASLIKTLEELGIGRPSTYAPIISTIQERNYVEKQGKFFAPTPLGIAVNDFLLEYFPEILDYKFTAQMEDDLDEIANGKKQRVPVLRSFYQPFENKLEGVKRIAQRVTVEVEATGEKCPKCKEGSVVIRVGRFGKFLSCSRFPECDWRAPYIKTVEGVKCPKCGGEIVYKKTKSGKGFYGCANWPKCDFASWKKPS